MDVGDTPYRTKTWTKGTDRSVPKVQERGRKGVSPTSKQLNSIPVPKTKKPILQVYFNSKIFLSRAEYWSGLRPTFVFMLSSIRITTTASRQPNTVKVLAVVVILNSADAMNVIANLNMFSSKLNDDDILFLKLTVVKLFKYCLISG